MSDVKVVDEKPEESKNQKQLMEFFETQLNKIQNATRKGFEDFGKDYVKSSEYKTKMDEFTKISDRIDEMEKKLARPPAMSAEQEATESLIAERKALRKWIQSSEVNYNQAVSTEESKGVTSVMATNNPGEVKIMSVSTDTYAGYLKTPPTFAAGITKVLTENSPIRGLATSITSDGDVKFRRRSTAASASSRTEAGAMTEATRAYAVDVLTPHEMYVEFDAYFWMLEDADYPVEQDMMADAGEAFAAKEGTWFVSGSGIGEAEGVIGNATIIADVRNQEEAATITNYDALIKLPYDLNDEFTRGGECVYVMRRATLGGLVTITDGVDRYMMKSDVSEPGVRRIEGYRIVTAPDMPAVAANAYAVIFGNFRKGYKILDRKSMIMVKDPFTKNTAGYVQFTFRKRVGGVVTNTAAFKMLKLATT